MVIVAELVKRLIVVQEIVGSSPIFHTNALMVKLVNTTALNVVSCRFESYWGYKWSYSLIGKTYRYER